MFMSIFVSSGIAGCGAAGLVLEEYKAGAQTHFTLYGVHPGAAFAVQVRCRLDHGSWSSWSHASYAEIPDRAQVRLRFDSRLRSNINRMSPQASGGTDPFGRRFRLSPAFCFWRRSAWRSQRGKGASLFVTSSGGIPPPSKC